MQYKLNIVPYEHYLYVQVSGDASYENALDLWKRIAKACEEHQCYNILGVQNLRKSVSTLDAFDHPKIFKEAGITMNHRIAWIDKNPGTLSTTEFIRNVLTNRSASYGRLFTNTEDAKKWLLSRVNKPT